MAPGRHADDCRALVLCGQGDTGYSNGTLLTELKRAENEKGGWLAVHMERNSTGMKTSNGLGHMGSLVTLNRKR